MVFYIQTTVAHDVKLDRTQTKEVGTYIGAVHKRRQFKGGGHTKQNTYLVLKVIKYYYKRRKREDERG